MIQCGDLRDKGHAIFPAEFSAGFRRTLPEMSLGKSVSRRAARQRDSRLLVSILSSNDPANRENATLVAMSPSTTGVDMTSSGLIAGIRPTISEKRETVDVLQSGASTPNKFPVDRPPGTQHGKARATGQSIFVDKRKRTIPWSNGSYDRIALAEHAACPTRRVTPPKSVYSLDVTPFCVC